MPLPAGFARATLIHAAAFAFLMFAPAAHVLLRKMSAASCSRQITLIIPPQVVAFYARIVQSPFIRLRREVSFSAAGRALPCLRFRLRVHRRVLSWHC